MRSIIRHDVVYYVYMRTNIDLDDSLIETAMRLTGERTKRAVVTRALEELIRVEGLRELRTARGRLRWTGDLARMREERRTHGTARRHQRAD